jgi:hypothetical protein
MRQALIVKNPKWEPFSKVSGEFKALSGEAALVVRGRVKEKLSVKAGEAKVMKSKPDSQEALVADMRRAGESEEAIKKAVSAFKPIKAAAAIMLLCLVAIGANAQQSLLSYLPATTFAATTTNTTAGTGILGWNIDQEAVLQLSVISTNNVATNAFVVQWRTSDNGVDWVSSAYSVSVTPTGTNSATAISRITNSVGAKWLQVGSVENPNAAAVSVQGFSLSLKEK